MSKPDPSGHNVIILAGEFAGQDSVCPGLVPNGGGLWAVSLQSSDRIVNLKFDEEFGDRVESRAGTGKELHVHGWHGSERGS